MNYNFEILARTTVAGLKRCACGLRWRKNTAVPREPRPSSPKIRVRRQRRSRWRVKTEKRHRRIGGLLFTTIRTIYNRAVAGNFIASLLPRPRWLRIAPSRPLRRKSVPFFCHVVTFVFFQSASPNLTPSRNKKKCTPQNHVPPRPSPLVDPLRQLATGRKN